MMNIFLCLMLLLISECSGEGTWLSHGEYDYYISTNTGSIDAAISECTSLDSDAVVASIKSEGIQMFLMNNLQSSTSEYFLGAMKQVYSEPILPEHFEWFDDGTSISYNNFPSSEPDDNPNNAYCVVLDASDGSWKTEDCYTQKYYICQRYNPNPPPTEPDSTLSTTTVSQSAGSNNPSQSVSGQPIVPSSQPVDPNTPADYKELYSETMELLIIVSSVSGGVIIILVVVILVLIYIRSATKHSSDDSDWGTMDKSRRSTTLGSQGTNMTYMWNSLSYADDARRKRDIPRPSVVGSTSTHSYMNRRYSRRPYSSVDLGYLPEEDKAYSTNGDTEHGEFNHMYDKLNM